jgi:ribonucleoside-diphosphate reductase subunit M1
MACDIGYEKVNNAKDIDIYIKDFYLVRAHNKFIPGSPAIYNEGSDKPVENNNEQDEKMDNTKRVKKNLSSCFLLTAADNSDSLTEICSNVALISKDGGGVGLHVGNMRERGAILKSSGGVSNGIVEYIKILETIIKYYRQPRRSGSIATYYEPYGPEFVELLQARVDEVLHKIFIGANLCDVLFERALKGLPWYFFSNQHPAHKLLYNSYGKVFTAEYNRLCENGAPTAHKNSFNDDGKTAKYTAMDIINFLAVCIQKKSVPYLLNRDVYNEHSNQKNLGIINCSNLCTEIILYSDKDQIACCIIGTINVATFYDEDTKQFDWQDFIRTVGIATRYLDGMIDSTGYPVYKAEISNKLHRPIALGIQGLADLFIKMDIEFGSKESRDMNIKLFESLYYHSIEESMKLAIHNGPYKSFRAGQTGIDTITKVNYKWTDSPTSQGQLHPFYYPNVKYSGRYDFTLLAKNVKIKGLRNSQCIGNAPTASTSVITGVTECVEPILNHITLRRLDNKDMIVVNKYLLRRLTEMKRNDIIEQLREGKCDLQKTDLPQSFKDVFKTWKDIHPAVYQQMMIDRAPFIDQSISNNHYLLSDLDNKINPLQTIKNLMFEAYRARLKTISYYFRQDVSSGKKQNFKQL